MSGIKSIRSLGASLLAIALATAGAAAVTAQAPGTSPDGSPVGRAPEGRIIYGTFAGQGQAELLHALTRDQPGERMIGDPVDCGTCAFVSPDGARIATLTLASGDAFTAVVMRSDGSDRQVLMPADGQGFGPGPFSGDSLYLAHWDEHDADVAGFYRVDPADLTGLERVTDFPQGESHIPLAVSPDGRYLLAYRSVTENGEHGDLLLITLETGALRRLTPEGTRVAVIPSVGVPGSFSPDSKRVAFGAYHGDQGQNAHPDQSAVYVADVDGGEAGRISTKGTGTISARWSPRGTEIAFQRLQDNGAYAIGLIEPTGTNEHLVDLAAPAGTSAWAPVWSPTGEWLVVQVGVMPHGFDLWAIRPDGTGLQRLTADPTGRGGVVWAP
jgi:Tol biopolymer transport system component